MVISMGIRQVVLFVGVLVPLIWLSAAAPAPVGNEATAPKHVLHVAVDGLRNDKGTVYFCLFSQPDGFPMAFERACRRGKVAVSKGKATIKLGELPPGRYALGVFHDENGNDALDKSTFGVPREGYGFSNNAKPRWNGPPGFEAAAFELNLTKTELTVQVTY
jgi:uncharacterized protein (DUF2141 family)